MRISHLVAAAMLIAGSLPALAQTNISTNVTTITKTTTTTVVATNNITTTNIATTVVTNSTVLKPKPPPPPPGWKSSVAFGLTIARGNTDSTQASVSAGTTKQWTQNILAFGSDALYGTSKPPGQPKQQESAETLHGFGQYNREFGDNFYAYGRLDGFHDGIADIKYRVTLAPGIGYYFLTNKVTDLVGEVGPGYIREQLSDETKSFATLRIAEKFHWNISPNARAWQTAELLPQVDHFDNYILNLEIGVEAKLTKSNKLSLRSVIQDSYNNIPAVGSLKNDLKIITSIVYNF